MKILKALLRKEFLLMRRNPFVPRVIVMLPLMVMLVIPLVANMDVRHVVIAIADYDHSQLSRRMAADISASEWLSTAPACSSHEQALAMVENGSADVALSIPSDFAKGLAAGNPPDLLIEANGVNSTKGTLGARYASAAIMMTLRNWQSSSGTPLPPSTVSVLNLYNPTLNFRNFMIPALIVMLIIIICGFLPVMSLVSEKESGTLEAINVTPVGKATFVLSKLIPYWIAGLLVVAVGMVVGWLVYGLAPAGSIGAILLAAVLFVLVMSGLGLIIANKSATILQSILVMFAIIMVFQLMSGLFTPISSMPGWAQVITYGVPPRYFIEIMRAVYLKGTPMADLGLQYGALALMALALCGLAAITYKKRS